MRALTYCDAKITSTRTTARQFKGHSSMGRWRKCQGKRFKMQALTLCNTEIVSTRTAADQFKGQFKGALDESSRNVQDASTHIERCCHGYYSLQSEPLLRN